jgi:hypothetical protein
MNRRQAIGTLMVGAAGALVPSVASGCVMTFQPGAVRADRDGRATFTAFIRLDHRRCILADPPDCVTLSPKNLKILKQSGWKKVRRGMFSSEFEVQLTANSGALKVLRECQKKGISEGTISITRS